jgi:branched-chain amino acid transport system substrate-binding protein
MTSQLNKIKAAGADTVIIYGIADGAAQVVRSMEKINYMPVTLGTWGNLSSLFPKMTGPKLAEHLIAAASTPRTPRIKPEPWVSVLRKGFSALTCFPCAAQVRLGNAAVCRNEAGQQH